MLDSNPRVTSVFHENQEIDLPTFRVPESTTIHPLDMGEILKLYVQATASFRLLDSLFSWPERIKGIKPHLQ